MKKIVSKLQPGMRVQAGKGEDHDMGIIDSVDYHTRTAIVRWDSLVVTAAPIAILKAAKAAERKHEN